MISVISVMPDTGLVPTMAMARAATVVNRNEMPPTTSARPDDGLQQADARHQDQKKAKTAARGTIAADDRAFIGRSRCVRSPAPPCCLLAGPGRRA